MSNNVSNPLDEEYLQNYTNAMNVIRKTIESQINGRTRMKITGFSYCEPSSQTDLQPKIRIDLNGTEGTGALSASIGPRACREKVNISMSLVDQGWPGGVKPTSKTANVQRVRVFNEPKRTSLLALHETMHMLGFHHTEFWRQDLSKSDSDVKRVAELGDTMDEKSIMLFGQVNFDAAGIAQLSDRDVQCLNHVADRTILDLPQRQADRSTYDRVPLGSLQRDNVPAGNVR